VSGTKGAGGNQPLIADVFEHGGPAPANVCGQFARTYTNGQAWVRPVKGRGFSSEGVLAADADAGSAKTGNRLRLGRPPNQAKT